MSNSCTFTRRYQIYSMSLFICTYDIYIYIYNIYLCMNESTTCLVTFDFWSPSPMLDSGWLDKPLPILFYFIFWLKYDRSSATWKWWGFQIQSFRHLLHQLYSGFKRTNIQGASCKSPRGSPDVSNVPQPCPVSPFHPETYRINITPSSTWLISLLILPVTLAIDRPRPILY